MGLANVNDDIWISSSSRGADGLSGSVGLVCQSGASAFGPFLVRSLDNGVGFSYIVSTGNEADLDFCDFARYLLDDDATKVIAGFVEGFKDGRKFFELARLAAKKGKPIVLIKIGRSELGSRAARSHTAALTGEDAVYDAAMRQFGVVRVQDYDELLEVSQLLAEAPSPPKAGIAVVSHSGGISSLTADMCGQAGLNLPALTTKGGGRHQRSAQGVRLGRQPIGCHRIRKQRFLPGNNGPHDCRAGSRHAGSCQFRVCRSGRAGDSAARRSAAGDLRRTQSGGIFMDRQPRGNRRAGPN